jgi:hypothetical protein
MLARTSCLMIAGRMLLKKKMKSFKKVLLLLVLASSSKVSLQQGKAPYKKFWVDKS